MPCLLGTQRCGTRGSGRRCALCIWLVVSLTPLQYKRAPRQMDRSWGMLTHWRGFAQACQMCLSHCLQQSQEESVCVCNGLADRRGEDTWWRWDLLYLIDGAGSACCDSRHPRAKELHLAFTEPAWPLAGWVLLFYMSVCVHAPLFSNIRSFSLLSFFYHIPQWPIIHLNPNLGDRSAGMWGCIFRP